MNKKIILAIIILLLGIGIYHGFFKKEKESFNLAEVVKGNISQEVSETGQVKKGEEINLSFKSAGRIEKIYVEVGKEVKERDILAKLETTQLQIQLQEAEATLSVAQAKSEKLLAGSSAEEIQLAETILANAYQEALNSLDSSYLKANDAFLVADLIQRTYFTQSTQESLTVKENTEKIEKAKNQIKSLLDTTKNNPEQKIIDNTILEIKADLTTIEGAISVIRDIAENPIYRNIVSSADKTSLDTQISNVNTAKSNLISKEGAIQKAKDELSLKKAPPRQEDVNLYQAQIKQAEAQINLLKEQISDATLRSPVAGIITKINKRIGETVQPVLGDSVISLLPATPFQIEVDIYEEDIIKMKVENPVDISLIAFPDQIFKGKVISIDPAEKLIEGVVYYEVTIDFEEAPEGIKPGMTADLVIKTASKENVLIIPEETIQKKDDKIIVQVLKDGVIEEREIKTGLKGSGGMIEVISGLNEGEEIILR